MTTCAAVNNNGTDPKAQEIIIIGAGVFGLTTALELHKRGYSNITVLDRHMPPVPDGSSVDVSRIIRFDYGDRVYAEMALESMSGWMSTYVSHFHPCGFLMVSDETAHPYVQQTMDVLRNMGQKFEEIPDATSLRRYFPSASSEEGTFVNGFANPLGGWADAEGAMRQLASQCSQANISIVTGLRGTVMSLVQSVSTSGKRRIDEVRVAQGPPFLRPARIILATGAWSSRLIDTAGATVSTAQPIASVSLSPEEASYLSSSPVCINVSSGVFVFPPNRDSLLKVVRHGYGYESQMQAGVLNKHCISSPPLTCKQNDEADQVLPKDAERDLRRGLKRLYPEFADRPFVRQRMCWYTDTPKGDFIIDDHPELSNMFLAIGGSGHAFKFLPVLGKHIVDCLENVAETQLRHKWRFDPRLSNDFNGDGSRGGPPRRHLTQAEQAKL